jgi:hypothetical protein
MKNVCILNGPLHNSMTPCSYIYRRCTTYRDLTGEKTLVTWSVRQHIHETLSKGTKFKICLDNGFPPSDPEFINRHERDLQKAVSEIDPKAGLQEGVMEI